MDKSEVLGIITVTDVCRFQSGSVMLIDLCCLSQGCKFQRCSQVFNLESESSLEYLVMSPSPVSSLYRWSLSQVSSIWSRVRVESLSLESESSLEYLVKNLSRVSSLYRWSLSQVSSIWSGVRVESQVFIDGVLVKRSIWSQGRV